LIFRTTHRAEFGAAGNAQLAFDVEDLALLGGDYDLLIGAAAADGEAAFERTARFAVAREPGSEGLIDLRGSWRSLASIQEVK
jgi:hypothetical protein